MTSTKIILTGAIIAGGIMFAGCTATTPQAQTPAPLAKPPVTNTGKTATNPPVGTTIVPPVAQGSLEAADQAIDNQNMETDFPNFTQQDLEK